MTITIIATGKKRSEYYDAAITEYTRRIVKPFAIDTVILDPAGHADASVCIERENTRVLEKLQPSDYVIALDERGRDITTEALAGMLEKLNNESTKNVVFIIGGAYGIDDRVRARANVILRLSSMTMPHELARLVLTEQLYRATNILGGGKYHH